MNCAQRSTTGLGAAATLLAGATGWAATWGAAAEADGGVTAGATDGRPWVDADPFAAALDSLCGGGDDGAFGSSARAADGLGSSVEGGADLPSAGLDAAAVTACGVAFDPAGAGADADWDDGADSIRVSVSFMSDGPPKNL